MTKVTSLLAPAASVKVPPLVTEATVMALVPVAPLKVRCVVFTVKLSEEEPSLVKVTFTSRYSPSFEAIYRCSYPK